MMASRHQIQKIALVTPSRHQAIDPTLAIMAPIRHHSIDPKVNDNDALEAA